MATPYIPPRDADLLAWAVNFSTLLTASPATYGLVAADATAVAAAEASFAAAYAVAVSPSTRTPTSVAAKDAARVNMLATVRPYAQRISKNAGVSTSNKIALGVNPGTNTPTPIVAPTSNPVLTIAAALSLQHVVRYRDVLVAPSVKAKPAGVIAIQLYAVASATVVTDPTVIPFIQINTKSPLLISWPSLDVGKQAYYTARWVTRTGLVGPWAPITNFTIAA